MNARIFQSAVMHKRLFPIVNLFTYGIYYLAIPLSAMQTLSSGWRFGVNRPGLLSFYEKDHGDRGITSLREWIDGILHRYSVTEADGEVVLIAMPRVLGYVFNPVSFWFCFDKEGGLRAVLAEVNNTFGETHSYLCVHDEQRCITQDDWLGTEKQFHVSPFLPREGEYQFRFAYGEDTLGIWINYHAPDGRLQLLTSLAGKLVPYNPATRRAVFWRYPLVTLKTIILIHWQALKLVCKGTKYIVKPVQKLERLSRVRNIAKM